MLSSSFTAPRSPFLDKQTWLSKCTWSLAKALYLNGSKVSAEDKGWMHGCVKVFHDHGPPNNQLCRALNNCVNNGTAVEPEYGTFVLPYSYDTARAISVSWPWLLLGPSLSTWMLQTKLELESTSASRFYRALWLWVEPCHLRCNSSALNIYMTWVFPGIF